MIGVNMRQVWRRENQTALGRRLWGRKNGKGYGAIGGETKKRQQVRR